MKDPIIQTEHISMDTIKSIYYAIQERLLIELKQYSYWNEKQNSMEFLCPEALKQLEEEMNALIKEKNKLDKFFCERGIKV